MRRSTKRRLIPLALALALAMVGAALAVPSITVHVQSIGVGSNSSILNPGVNHALDDAKVNWILDSSDPDFVTGFNVILNDDLSSGAVVYVKVFDSSNVLLSNGSVTIGSSGYTAGTPLTVPLKSKIDISQIDRVTVIVKNPELS